MPESEEAITAIDAAMAMVNDLCQGRKKWIMSIPARPDVDPDLVITTALVKAKAFVENVSLEAANA